MPISVPYPDGSGPPNPQLPDFGYDIEQEKRFYQTKPPPLYGYKREFNEQGYEVENWDCGTGVGTGQWMMINFWEYTTGYLNIQEGCWVNYSAAELESDYLSG